MVPTLGGNPPRSTILFRLYEPLVVSSQLMFLPSRMFALMDASMPRFRTSPMFTSREVAVPADGAMVRLISASLLDLL